MLLGLPEVYVVAEAAKKAKTARAYNTKYGLDEVSLREEGGKYIEFQEPGFAKRAFVVSIVEDPLRGKDVVRVEIGGVTVGNQQ